MCVCGVGGGGLRNCKYPWIAGPSRVQELLELIYFNYPYCEDEEFPFKEVKVPCK